LIPFVLLWAAVWAAGVAGAAGELGPVLAAVAGSCRDCRQLLYVGADGGDGTRGRLWALERRGQGWEIAFGPLPVNLGRNGIAPAWAKREGDGRTPSGVYPLRRVFGYEGRLDTRLAYRPVRRDLIWVDDPHSPQYNRPVRRREADCSSWEEMLRPDGLYRHVLVVEYNTDPVVKGCGSAIFLHVWEGEGVPTSGCIALAACDLKKVIAWLDPEKAPRVAIGSPADLTAALGGPAAGLPPDVPPALAARLEKSDRKLAELRSPAGFFAVAASLPRDVEAAMVERGTWRPSCPVPLSDLAYIVTRHRGWDGRDRYGELVVHRALAAFFLDVLGVMYETRFPVRRMELIETFGGSDEASMAADNTSAFNCRAVTGRRGVFSRHSYGVAVDINPRENPYLKGLDVRPDGGGGSPPKASSGLSPSRRRLVLPPDGVPFLDRGERREGMLWPGHPVVERFKALGFAWGGDWADPVDYQHFEYDFGRISKRDRRGPAGRL